MGLLRATTTFHTVGRITVSEGDIVDAADPIVKGREALFVSVDEATISPKAAVETSRRRPGTKSNARRIGEKPAAKQAAPAPAKQADKGDKA